MVILLVSVLLWIILLTLIFIINSLVDDISVGVKIIHYQSIHPCFYGRLEDKEEIFLDED